ncbi:MAG: hypothetical protein AAF865_14480 [Pseudomonadota bacterium]
MARGARLERLEKLAGLVADAERLHVARAVRSEARLADEAQGLNSRRADAAGALAAEAAPDLAMIRATGAWLRASQDELRRLNIQRAALRARSETARAEAARAIARHRVLETLLKRPT